MSQKVIELLPEDGILYGCTDYQGGEEVGLDSINARVAAQAKAFEAAYSESTSSMDFSGRDPAAKVAEAKTEDGVG